MFVHSVPSCIVLDSLQIPVKGICPKGLLNLQSTSSSMCVFQYKAVLNKHWQCSESLRACLVSLVLHCWTYPCSQEHGHLQEGPCLPAMCSILQPTAPLLIYSIAESSRGGDCFMGYFRTDLSTSIQTSPFWSEQLFLGFRQLFYR